MDKEMMAKVLNDREFLTEVLKYDDDIEIERVFKDRGINLPLEDLDEVCDIIHVYKSLSQNRRLDDSEIDKVVGGIREAEGRIRS